jgi:hypothetical protein
MLGDMMGYPFALLRRKPFTVITAFVTFALALLMLDILFAASGQDLLSAGSDPFSAETRPAFQAYNFLSGVVGLAISAIVMGAALIDLNRRDPDDRPTALDGLKFFVLNIKFGFMVVLPFALVGGLVIGFALQVGGTIAGVVAAIPVVLAFIYLSIRLYLAWPRALASDHQNLWGTLAITKGKFWPLLGLFIAAHIVAMMPLLALSFGTEMLSLAVYYPIDSLEAVLTPHALIYAGLYDVTVAFATIFMAAVPAFLFNAIDPVQPDLAEVF